MEFKFEYVLYIIYAILALILVFNMLRGLKQGSRKGFYNIIMTIVFWVAYFVILTFIPAREMFQSPGLYSLIKNFGITNPEAATNAGVEVTNLPDFLLYLLAPVLKDNLQMDILAADTIDTARDLILCFGDAVMKLIFIIPVVILHSIVKRVIYNIWISKLCETSKRKLRKLEKRNDKYFEYHHKENPKYTKQIERIEKNRSRLIVTRPLGLLMGAIRGFISCFIIMAFINALAFTIPKLPDMSAGGGAVAEEPADDESTNKEFTDEEKGLAVYRLMDAFELGEVANYISMYQNSFAAKFTQIPIGEKTLDKLFIDGIFKGSTETRQLTLRQDIEDLLDGVAQVIAVIDSRPTADGKSIWTKIKESVSEGSSLDVNFLELITSGPASDFNGVVSALFDTSIVTNFLPIAMEYIQTIDLGEDITLSDFLDPTLKEAKDWKNEFNNLLTALDEITNNGENPIKEISADTFDFKQLLNIRTTTLLRSNALTYAIIGMLTSGSKGEGLLGDVLKDFIAMPDALTVKTNNKYAESWYGETGEFAIMVDAIKAILNEIDDFNKIGDSFPKLIMGIKDSGFEKSEVLRCTLSKILEGDLLGDVGIILPPEAYAEKKVIIGGEEKSIFSETEIKNAVNGIAAILDSESDEFDLSKINFGTLSDSADSLLQSKIIHATISKLVQDADIFVVDENLYDETYIDGAELKTAIQSIADILGRDLTISEISFDIDSILEKTTELKKACDSKILRATITNILKDTITIPDSVMDSFTDIKGNPAKAVTKEEIIKLIDGYSALEAEVNAGKPESEKVKGLDLFSVDKLSVGTLSKESLMNTLLDSKIIHATISKLLCDQSANVVINKTLYTDASKVYIDKGEIKSLLSALVGIMGNDSSIFDVSTLNVDKILSDTTALKNALNSTIICDTMSKYMFDITSISIPNDVKVNITDINDNNKTSITKAELEKVIDAYGSLQNTINAGKPENEKLSGTAIFNMNNLSLSMLADDNLINALCASKIINKTISNILINNPQIKVGVDDQYKSNDGTILYDGNYIKETELKKLFKSISMIASGNVNNISIDSSSLLSKTDSEIDQLFDSEIIVNTISQKIYDLFDSNAMLEFLTTSINSEYGFTARTITVEEEKALYKAISILGAGDLDTLSFDFNKLTSLTDEEIQKICKSNLISYNAYLQIKDKNSAALNNMLEIDPTSEKPYVRNWFYNGESFEENNLFGLIKALGDIYASEDIVSVIEGTGLEKGASLAPFKSKSFINSFTSEPVLCDSLPNILSKFTSALDLEGCDILGIPQRFNKDSDGNYVYTAESWKQYWGGDGSDDPITGYTSGELYKLFDGISAINDAVTEASKGIGANIATIEALVEKAKRSEILSSPLNADIFVRILSPI